MYSNSSDSNYTNHTPSLASIYQVTHDLRSKYALVAVLNLSLGETESDKKLIVAGEIQYHIFCLVNIIVVGKSFFISVLH